MTADESTLSDQQLLGERLRAFRTSRRMSMRELAAAAEVSVSYVHQIENGTANAGIKVLRRLADVFSIQWIDFFSRTDRTDPVLRKAERPSFTAGGGTTYYSITPAPLLDIEVSVTEYEPGAVVGDDDYAHGDIREIFLVVRGRFRFRLAGVDYEMFEGDSIDFRSSVTHSITNIGDEVGEGVWVSNPPSSLAGGATAGAQHRT